MLGVQAMDSFKEGLRLDPKDPVCAQGLQNITSRIHDNDPERAQRAMEDPEIQVRRSAYANWAGAAR